MSKRLALAVLLAVASSSAAAEWLSLVRDEAQTTYADPSTIRRAGDMVKMWDMYDYTTVQVSTKGKPYRSSKHQYEYDCKGERGRLLFFSYHSGNMGGGAAVEIQTMHSEWVPVAPGTRFEILWKVACGKR